MVNKMKTLRQGILAKSMFIIFIFSTGLVFSQKNGTEAVNLRSGSIGLGTGLNAYSGLIGIIGEVPIVKNASVFGAAGLGSWGFKIGFGVAYNLNPSNNSPQLSVGFSSASGLSEMELDLETVSGVTEPVLLNLKRANTLNLMYHKPVNVGKKNKFVFGVGYGLELNQKVYDVKSNHILSDKSVRVMEIMQPGGLIFSLSFMFGL